MSKCGLAVVAAGFSPVVWAKLVKASLVLFDLDSFTTRVLFGPGSQSPARDGATTAPAADGDADHNDPARSFKLTALADRKSVV